MSIKCGVAALALSLSVPLAVAQNAPQRDPSVVECKQGYREGMPWTRQQFVEFCAKLEAKDRGK